ncbi:MAG: glycosyl hydrolase [Acutalibacteraceae bacterium]|nr:glycosyl hydrolase [Acutalibacteraceae bacterium]
MLYPKNQDKVLNEELFKNPTSEYRCTPFWAWNCDLKLDELKKEIDFMKEMGMGGFHMHTRVGQSTEYLSDAYMANIKGCTEKAKKENMLSWLYDEDKWPSGSAGGLVTKKYENRQKYLLGTFDPSTAKGPFLAKYDIELDTEGYLISYKKIGENDDAENKAWYAFLETEESSPWYNNETYVDTLSKSAIDDFIQTTHERYKEVVGEDFGAAVPAIFTDEPQVYRKSCMDISLDENNSKFPFTTDFAETYKNTYGVDFFDTLPELVWEKKEGCYLTRHRYHDHATERFAEAFCDNVGAWCDKNNILLTGHMMEEPTLESQTCAIGEAMRAYRSFSLPGVDMLCDSREFTTVKQAASATHQFGYPGVLSELYGVTNWDFDFRGHKLQGDWQAALGVTVRVPHLYWVSMRGEAKRDYPASIGHQSSWYKEYSFIENHFARVNTMLTRGAADVKIGVIHPVESYWIHYGPNDKTGVVREELDERFRQVTEWLLYGTLDFDFICESLLKDQFGGADKTFKVGKMDYDVVIVPACETIRKTTLDALNEFTNNGGKVIIMGEIPTLVDAVESGEPAALAQKCEHISWSKSRLYESLKAYRTIEIRDRRGNPSNNLMYQLRNDGDGKNLFICHVKDTLRSAIDEKESYTIRIKGEFKPVLMDSLSGDISDYPASYYNGDTLINWECYSQSSILLRLEPGKAESDYISSDEKLEPEYLADDMEIILDEPNVCVLDMAEWKIDDGEWQEKEETLRLCVKAKESLGFSTDSIHGVQPWVLGKIEPKNTITTKMTFVSDIEVENAMLALEDFDESEIIFNGNKIEKISQGYYVDFSITKVSIGKINKGENTVIVTKPFTVVSNVENMFILGDFGVDVKGTSVRITAPQNKIHFGDITKQGLPFYGGVMTYRFKIEGGKDTKLCLGLYAAPCVCAELDGKRIANLSLSPYSVDLGKLSEGEHTLDLVVSLSRINTFGSLHMCDGRRTWFGPDGWYTEDEDWTYVYMLKSSGLLTAPRFYKK